MTFHPHNALTPNFRHPVGVETMETGTQTGLCEGDRIRLDLDREGLHDFTVEKFRDCLGIFLSPKHREAGEFTPLCELYEFGAGSSRGYIGNFGEYVKDPVPMWMQIPKREETP